MIPGSGDAGDLASKKLEKIYTIDHPALKMYTPDGFTAALEQLIRQTSPQYVLFPTLIRFATMRRSWPRDSTRSS